MQVQRLQFAPNKQCPYTHRVSFDFEDLQQREQIYDWVEGNFVPGVWAGNSFYTTAKYVTFMTLKWSHTA